MIWKILNLSSLLWVVYIQLLSVIKNQSKYCYLNITKTKVKNKQFIDGVLKLYRYKLNMW